MSRHPGHADDRWFLSLYINSMPLIFAFRIVDCVLAMGVKVLFQIGLGEYGAWIQAWRRDPD